MKLSNEWLRFFLQNAVLGVASYLLYLLFFWSKSGIPFSHQINRAWADVSILLLCISLMIGPLVRISPQFKLLIPWRRDIGLWFAITSLIHIGLLAQLHLKWNLLRFFFNEEGKLLKQTAHASNWIGLVALLGMIVLSVTSNRYSEKLLGSSSWKFVQQSAYSVFWLVVLHTFIFVYMLDARKALLFQWFFWSGAIAVIGFQFWGFILTVKIKRRKDYLSN